MHPESIKIHVTFFYGAVKSNLLLANTECKCFQACRGLMVMSIKPRKANFLFAGPVYVALNARCEQAYSCRVRRNTSIANGVRQLLAFIPNDPINLNHDAPRNAH